LQREVVVVRHAIAFERDGRRWPDDALRPLTPEGKRRFRKAARGLRRCMARVDTVLTSPFVRARETAAILEEVAHWPAAHDCDELVPDSPPARLIALLSRRRARRIAVVGHEPHLSAFIAACLTQRERLELELRKGGVAHLLFDQRLEGGGRLVAFLPPRVLRSVAKT
jgi:phosphohistidine phosphatase